MKHTIQKVVRSTLQWRGWLIVGLTAMIVIAGGNAVGQTVSVPVTLGMSGRVFLPAIGGGGGGQFFAPCPAQQNLVGFEMRVGDDVDAISPVCAKSTGPTGISDLRLTNDGNAGLVPGSRQPNQPNGDLFAELVTAPGWHGGTGGGFLRLLCPADTPIVIGLDVAAQGQRTIIVHNVHVFCGRAVAAQSALPDPSAVFDGNGSGHPNFLSQSERCPTGQVAVGMHGRSGVWLDAMGLICDAPIVWETTAREPVKAVGRVKVTTPDSTPGPPRTICQLARDARARNSPAASGLEAQCRAAGAAGEPTPVKAVGRVKSTTADATPGPPVSICERAQEARARNSPAAAGLETQCRLNDLATTGAAIANQDSLAVELRNREPNDSGRRGFDIGMGAAEGNTANGPGKQKIRGLLDPAEQAGFDIALEFSLERNPNAELAAKGAAIAQDDPTVAEARTAESDVFYWLGFDIATGIFGDPALGALGNTAIGPGSLRIRDALNAAGQKGFNASVKLHLSRNYTP